MLQVARGALSSRRYTELAQELDGLIERDSGLAKKLRIIELQSADVYFAQVAANGQRVSRQAEFFRLNDKGLP